MGKSEHAVHFGFANAAAGAVGYAVMATLALWREGNPVFRKLRTRGLQTISVSAAGASAFLLREQKAKVKAWCFWCISSAVINGVICTLSLTERAAWSPAKSA